MALYHWSQTAASNATADPTVNMAEGMAPSAVNDGIRALMASAAKWRDDITGILVTAGTSTNYTITSNQTITANMDGFTVQFTPGSTNGGATTLSVDSQAAKPLRFLTGVDLPAGALISGSLYQATYRAATQEWLLHSFDGSIYSIPIGAAVDYFGSTAPNGAFVLAYGQAISRSTYATLFSLFSTTYGSGDGSSTFNIPDLRGRVIAGAHEMGGSAPSPARLSTTYLGANPATLGSVGGSESHTLTAAQLPSITSTGSFTSSGTSFVSSDENATSFSTGTGGATGWKAWFTSATISRGSVTGSLSVTSSGTSGSAHNNIQPTIIANKLLRII